MRSADRRQLTQQGAIVGTPAYMAPEQARGEPVDARCDLFSLGCVLYRLCTGELPFQGTDMISTLMAVATDEPRPPHELEPDLPPALSELIMHLLAKEPRTGRRRRRRWSRPWRASRRRCREPSGTLETPARPGSPDLKTALLRRRNGRILAGVAACLLLAGLLVLWAAGVFKVKTKDGIIVVQVNEPTPRCSWMATG